MGLRPSATVRGKIDFNRSYFERKVDYPLKTTNNYTQDGDVMIFTSETGGTEQVVDRSAGSANEQFAGVALSDFRRITDFVNLEQRTVPSATAFTIQAVKSSGVANPYVYDVTSGAALTEGNPANDNEYSMSATGLFTFKEGTQAGHVVILRYTYTPDIVELNGRFPAPAYIMQAQRLLAQVCVGVGFCKVFTTQYDTSKAYTLRAPVYTGASGKFTTTTTPVCKAGRVCSLPSVGDPYLGVEYNIGSVYTDA